VPQLTAESLFGGDPRLNYTRNKSHGHIRSTTGPESKRIILQARINELINDLIPKYQAAYNEAKVSKENSKGKSKQEKDLISIKLSRTGSTLRAAEARLKAAEEELSKL
jgi:hypothetical protein